MSAKGRTEANGGALREAAFNAFFNLRAAQLSPPRAVMLIGIWRATEFMSKAQSRSTLANNASAAPAYAQLCGGDALSVGIYQQRIKLRSW